MREIIQAKKAQAAVEFLIVVGIAFSMLVPALFLFSQYSEGSNQMVVASQVQRVGKELISNAEAMYYYGEHSKTTVKLSFPDNINSMYLNPKINSSCVDSGDSCVSEIVFNVTLFNGETSFVFFSKVNLTVNFTADYTMSDAVGSGFKSFQIESYGDYINISRKIG